MAVRDSHGVLVAYFGFNGSVCPAIHRPYNCRWNASHLVWEHTELFPDLESARASGYYFCGICLPEEEAARKAALSNNVP